MTPRYAHAARSLNPLPFALTQTTPLCAITDPGGRREQDVGGVCQGETVLLLVDTRCAGWAVTPAPAPNSSIVTSFGAMLLLALALWFVYNVRCRPACCAAAAVLSAGHYRPQDFGSPQEERTRGREGLSLATLHLCFHLCFLHHSRPLPVFPNRFPLFPCLYFISPSPFHSHMAPSPAAYPAAANSDWGSTRRRLPLQQSARAQRCVCPRPNSSSGRSPPTNSRCGVCVCVCWGRGLGKWGQGQGQGESNGEPV